MQTSTIFNRSGLFITVFITGASVMVIELLGTRMIAPFYGASLYVWSSLISVTMIALAVGYYAGGRWADRVKRTGLSVIIALAALFTLLIPLATRTVLLATDFMGLRAGAFVSALVLFSPSLTFLGMVGPFAIKFATSTIEGVGNNVGSMYAMSTVGSVIGTLVLGFFLFPVLGSREILLGTGLILLVLALLIGVYEQKQLQRSMAIVPSALVAVLALSLLPKIVDASHHYKRNAGFNVLSEQESLYGWVRVIDQPSHDLRLLTADASTIGAANISNGQSRLSYQDIVAFLPALSKEKMQRALIIGLGAGHMAQVLDKRYGMVTDTLEIDPAIAEAAVKYFNFTPTGKAIVGDARYEIRHLTGPYDLIIHDCFTGGSEPAHLLTVETLQQLRGLLSKQGMLAINFVALEGKHSAALASVAKTVEQVFAQQLMFVSEPGKEFNDYIILASQQPLNLASTELFQEQKNWLTERLFSVDKALGVVLTDNLNPLESLQTAKAEHYRRFIVDWLGPELLVR